MNKPKATKVGEHYVELSWKEPEVAVEYYCILSKSETSDSDIWVENNIITGSTTGVADELMKKCKYKFKIRAKCKSNDPIIESAESNVVETEKNASASIPGKPIIKGVTTTTATLHWTPPEVNGDFVKNYKVTIKRQNGKQKRTEKSLHPEITIDDLTPSLCYIAYVSAKAYSDKSSDKSPPSNFFETKVEGPSKPLMCNKTHNTISLKWDDKQKNTRYCVFYDSLHDFGRKETDSTKVTIDYLHPYTTYTFSVAILQNSYVSQRSDEFTTRAYNCSQPGIPNA